MQTNATQKNGPNKQ